MRAAIALGSNLPSQFGNASANIREALYRIKGFAEVVLVSPIFQTAPVGFVSQPDFQNAAALISTTLGPLTLLRHLLEVEHSMGRIRSADAPPKGPRIIDLDLLLFENEQGQSLILNDPDLTLPHPEMAHRRFVLEPLAEIAPELMHPVLQRTILELVKQLDTKKPSQIGSSRSV